jgi:hypothetical protein
MFWHNGSAAKTAFLGFDDSAGKLTFIPDASISSEVASGAVGIMVANLEGNVTGDLTGTVQTAAQTNITSLGTLTTLTVDNIIINATTIGHTSDTDLLTLASGELTIAGTATVSDDFTLNNSSPEMYFSTTSASHFNWMIAAQENVDTALEFTPSNAAGVGGTYDTPALTLYANRDATFAGDTVTFTSANANDPLVIIQNTANDATSAALRFNKNRGADAQDNDMLGRIDFYGYDDGTPSTQHYAQIGVSVKDASSGAEGGEMFLGVANHDGGMENGLVLSDGSADGEIDVTIGSGTSSVTTIAGDASVTGAANITGLLTCSATGDNTISTSSTAKLLIQSSGANGNDVHLGLKSSDTTWLLKTNRGDQISGNQGDFFIREDTAGVNALILETNNGNATFAGNVSVNAAGQKAVLHVKNEGNNWEDGILIEHDSGNTGWNLHPENNSDNALWFGYNAATDNALTSQTATTVLKLNSDKSAVFEGEVRVNSYLRLYTTDDQANNWYLYTHTDDTFRMNYNGSGNDEITMDTSGNITFAGNVAVGGGALKTYHSNVTSVIELDDQASIFTRANETYIGQNIYYDSGDDGTAIEAGKGTLMRLRRGEINMYFSAAAASSADDTHSLQEKFTFVDSGNFTMGSGIFTIKNATGDSSGLRIFQDSSDASKIYNNYAGTLELGLSNTTMFKIANSGGNIMLFGNAGADGYTLPYDQNAGYSNFSAGGFGFLYREAHDSYITHNLYYYKTGGSSTWRYKFGSAGAGIMYMDNGIFGIMNVGSGSADDVANLTERFKITAAGDSIFTGTVALAGSNAAEKKLTINNSTANGIQFNYDNSNNYRNQILNYWNTNTDSRMDFNIARSNGATPETILSVGYNQNVGVGTAAPAARLHVVGLNATRNSYTDTLVIDGGRTVAHPYSGFGTGINFKGDDYSDEERNYASIRAIMESSHTSTSSVGDLGFKSFLSFYTNSGGAEDTDITEKMRITSGGSLLVNTTDDTPNSVALKSAVVGYNDGTMFASHFAVSTTSSSTAMIFSNPNGQVGSITTNASATAFNTSSDYRLKEDLKDFNGLELVSNIKVYDFKWKSDDKRNYGVIAHELQEIIPQAVVGEKDDKEMQQADYSKLVPVLLKSIQELEARVKELENK